MSRFNHGQVVMTSGFEALFPNSIQAQGAAIQLLNRHVSGDWGDVDKGDKRRNEEALIDGERILSKYTVTVENRAQDVYVITEADRRATTVLLTHEY